MCAGLLEAEHLRQQVQQAWVDLAPFIDSVATAATVDAAEHVRIVNNQTTNIEIISAALAVLTALGFAALASRSYRLVLLRDQSLEHATARFKDFAFASSDIFLDIDAKGRIRTLDGQEDLVSTLYGAGVIGETFDDSMDRLAFSPEAKKEFTRTFNERKAIRDFEYRAINHKTGQEQWYSMSGLPVFDDTGEFAGFRCAARNITAQREAEFERSLAESRLSSIVENLPLAFFRIEDAGSVPVVTFISANVEHVMGLKPDQFHASNGADFGRFLHEEDRERVTAEVRAGLRETGSASSRGRIRFPDGSVRWIQHVIRLITPKDNGAVMTYEGMWIDVTEEETWLRQLRDFEQAINTSDEAFCIMDTTTRKVSYYSAGYGRLFGYPTDRFRPDVTVGASGEAVGKKLDDIFADMDRDDATPDGWHGEFTWKLKNGTVYHFLGHARALPDNRRVVVLTEISDRVAQERELLAITTAMTQASDGILIFKDEVGPILYANTAVLEMFRLPTHLAVEGRYLADFLPQAGRMAAGALRSDATAAMKMADGWAGQRDVVRADGSPLSLLVRVTRLPDQRVVVIMTDITDRIQKEAQEQKLRRQLADAQRLEAIGSLAGGIAHDFNNIIGAARGFADLLVADLPEGEPRHFAERIVATCRRAAALVREIMAFSRVKDEEREPVDIRALIDEAGDILTGRIGPNLQLEIHNDAESCRVLGNLSQLTQVISNVLINAADATPSSGGKITLTTRCLRQTQTRTDEAQWNVSTRLSASGRTIHVGTQGVLSPTRDYLCLQVEDDGTGMTQTTVRRLFEPFFTTKEKSRGTGLGLAVVASIVNAHEGAIRVETLVAGGTTFEIYIPLAEASDTTTRETTCMSRVDDNVPVRGTERILIVDDEVDIADSLAIALSRLGYEAAPVYDSKEALEIFNEDPSAWDVVISDQSMPKMRGVQLIRKMKVGRPDIRTIICTGHSDALTAARAAYEGVDAFFNKPVAAETLAKAVRALFAASSQSPDRLN